MKTGLKQIVGKYWPRKLRHPLPVRILHWTYAPAALVLLYTGVYIAHPGTVPFLNMKQARRLHFACQFLFMGGFLGRLVYGSFNRRYREIIPGKSDLAALPQFIRHQLFLTRKEPHFPKYNIFQKLVFLSWVPVIILKGLTGAVLYAPNRAGRLEAAFGGLERTRRMHYLTTLYLGPTILGHLYFAATKSKQKLKSIFTGYQSRGNR